jgi:hypothetical protein
VRSNRISSSFCGHNHNDENIPEKHFHPIV